MRRRQVFAAASAAHPPTAEEWAEIIKFSPLPDALFDRLRDIPVERAPLPRGTCQKCGRKVGQGLAMHRKHCKGVSDG